MATTGSTPALSSPGIGSGLDVNAIVSKLMAVESQPLTRLDQQEAAYQAKISAYGSVKGALSSFQTALQSLADPATFGAFTATPGDASILAATAGSSAVAGSYAVEVTQLAQAQKIASSGFANTNDVVGSGTLTFQFGTFDGASFTPNGTGAKTVTIGAGQNTLAGIRDAVNAAAIGVTATIVNDGSANGNRLVFTSNASGAANSLKVSVSDGDGNDTDAAGLSQLAYDPTGTAGNGKNMTQKVAAQNATLIIDGISVSKPSNTVTDAIQGVTLSLSKTNVGSPTTLSVAQDASGVTKAVQAFVKAYNDLHTTLNNLTKFDAASKQASILTGDTTVRLIESRLSGILGSALSTAGGSNLNTLSQVGISLQHDGTLTLDTAKLNSAAGSFGGIAKVFAAIGQATDSLISVTATGAKTQPGSYAVNVTQLATRGNTVGSASAGLTITAGVNDQLAVTIDGLNATVTLSAGVYASADALAAEVQSQINGAATLTQNGSSVAVTASSGALTITSNRYGSASNVTASGTAAATLLGNSPTSSAGVDIAGTIGGVAATGSGQILSGAVGSATEGLSLQIAGGTLGARGTVSYTQGYAYRLNQAVTQFLDTGGIVAAGTDGLNNQIKDIDHRRDELQQRLTIIEANYRQQFTALDALLGSMSTTSTFLQQQLANLPKISNG